MRAALWVLSAVAASGVAVGLAVRLQRDVDEVARLEPGDCLVVDAAHSIGYSVVDCATPHTAQVVRLIDLAPSVTLTREDMAPTCFGSIPPRTQSAYSEVGAEPIALVSSSGRTACLITHALRSGSVVDEVRG